MSRIRVRLFGGFEVGCGDRPLSGFESQKVRALLAYLVYHQGRPFSRDHLIGLLWAERDEGAARHALRQAVYNLRSILRDAGLAIPILASHAEVQWNPAVECWIDVVDFESSLRRGTAPDTVDPYHLVSAAQLYRGDFLAGFFVRDSPAYEDWLAGEQERLRATAIDVLRLLIDRYRRRGEYRFGIHYARQLVAVEPLAEEAHRDLMQLFALAGRPRQALAAYDKLQGLLDRELGVEPVAETRALYASILGAAKRPAAGAAAEEREPLGPLIPLVGREEPWEALETCCRRVLQGRAELTLVAGEAGAGKTRLVRSFLDATASRHGLTVLSGRCYELAPRLGYGPFREILESALAGGDGGEILQDLARTGSGLFGAVVRGLGGLCGGAGPLVLVLDDLHLADDASFDLLAAVLAGLSRRPLWVIAIFRPAGLPSGHPLLAPTPEGTAGATVTRLGVERLPLGAVEEIAARLVGGAQAAELGAFLAQGEGLPLVLSELINYLWDERLLDSDQAGSWRLAAPLDTVQRWRLPELILARFRKLPSSTRRLAAVAAVLGQRFESGFLARAGEEHPAVVEIGLDLLQERWWIRPFFPAWQDARREPEPGAEEIRRGSFEFAQKHIRAAVYRDLSPRRRRFLHGQVARLLEEAHGERSEPWSEALAYHLVAAGELEKALVHVERAAVRAHALTALDTARHYDREASAIRRRLAGARREEGKSVGREVSVRSGDQRIC